MLRVYAAVHEHDGLEEVATLEQFKLNYATLVNCDPTRDVILAEVDGEPWRTPASSGTTWSRVGGRTRTSASCTRRGAGAGSAARCIGTTRLGSARSPPSIPAWSRSGSGRRASTPTPATAALLLGDGYTAARYFYDMVAPVARRASPRRRCPTGIELRPVTRDQYRRIWEAAAEAFRDHWGERSGPRGLDALRCEPENADPALWRIGWDGDQVAGAIVTYPESRRTSEYGRSRVYVSMVSVRRQWRRRGLARALLAGSLVASREAGFTSASLGVDTDSPTGATALYESLGFAPEKTFTAYRKPMERGVGPRARTSARVS